jgi:hypothetical protein
LLASELNAIVDEIRRNAVVSVEPPLRLIDRRWGKHIAFETVKADTQEAGLEVGMFLVMEGDENYAPITTLTPTDFNFLRCFALDENGQLPAGPTVIKVAKPYDLQGQSWQGNTVRIPDLGGNQRRLTYQLGDSKHGHRRTVTDADNPEFQETQVIVPFYHQGARLLAVKLPIEMTRAPWSEDIRKAIQWDVEWLDLNIDGRQWAAEREPLL